MGKITSRNISLVAAGLTLIVIIIFLYFSWNTLFFVSGIYETVRLLLFCVLLFFILFYLTVMLLSGIFQVIPLSYGTYSSERFGLSLLLPQGWEDATDEEPRHPEIVVRARDRERVAALNIIAGPQPYGPHPSLADLEREARRDVDLLNGDLISLERIKIGGTDAVMAVYTAHAMMTKKVGLVKDDTEFIITCSSAPELFPAYSKVFDDCLQSLVWIPKK
jgi:hypothetical protein